MTPTSPFLDAMDHLVAALDALAVQGALEWRRHLATHKKAAIATRLASTGGMGRVCPLPARALLHPGAPAIAITLPNAYHGSPESAHTYLTHEGRFRTAMALAGARAQEAADAMAALPALACGMAIDLRIHPRGEKSAPRLTLAWAGLELWREGNSPQSGAPLQWTRMRARLAQALAHIAPITAPPTQSWAVFPSPSMLALESDLYTQTRMAQIVRAGSAPDAARIAHLLHALTQGYDLTSPPETPTMVALPIPSPT